MEDRSIEEILLDLKCKGESELYVLKEGLEFICRPLSYKEHAAALEIYEVLGEIEAHEVIVKMCTVYPETDKVKEWIDNSSDEPDRLAKKILDISYFGTKEDIVNLHNSIKDSLEQDFMTIVTAIISRAFQISPLDIDNMSMNDIMTLFVKAQFALESYIDIEELFGLKSSSKPSKDIQLPIAPGMQTTDPTMTKEYMLDPSNASPIPPEAFKS